ncbi:hypothetical protein [Paenibacillus sp. 23TSA30-6]|uniref:hypothetical protein n=1 Tax=Paenibacillus sp. 23TSA30-6 TaxID=2546104 RepID=UPI001EE1A5B8|nr:hypothetical protein [Paenibacillus sp. 23TSA30-6]
MNNWESEIIQVDDEHAIYSKYFHSVRELSNDYIWYHFDQVPLLRRHFFVTVCFKDTSLIVVEISLQGDEFPISWDNVSE